jgi:pilus assembly protein CpaD
MNRSIAIAALGLTVLVSACASAGGSGPPPVTPTSRFQMEAVSAPEQIALAAHPEGLSDNQRGAVSRFALDWADNGGGLISISAPSNGGDAANRTAWAAKQALQQAGVSPDAVRVVAYTPDQAGAPVLIAYDRFQAVVPQCGREWTDLTKTRKNETQANFGCAVTANMAAQIDNAADIRGPRSMTPADAGRRGAVMDKYRKGEPTESKSDDKNAGKVSTAVGN